MPKLRRSLTPPRPLDLGDPAPSRLMFLDFEASSLLIDSFPIEVGWVDEEGRSESHLIRPHDEWLAGGCSGWSPQSEAVHGISMEALLRDGMLLAQVAARVAEVLSAPGITAVSDAPGFDAPWLETLFEFGGRDEVVGLADVRLVYGWACRPLLDLFIPDDRAEDPRAEEHGQRLAHEIVARAEEVEQLRRRVRHRALPDAESLWRTWTDIRDEVDRHLVKHGHPRQPGLLFRAEHRGETVEIGRAGQAELTTLAGTLPDQTPRDILTVWTLVALRWSAGRPTEVHALGWREAERNVWITSPIVRIDTSARLVRTRSGHVYRLGEPDLPDLAPSLRSHLLYALRTWGYADVRR